jgi:hypothetical protein
MIRIVSKKKRKHVRFVINKRKTNYFSDFCFEGEESMIEFIRLLFAKLLCRIFGHKYTADNDAYDDYDNYPCERDCLHTGVVEAPLCNRHPSDPHPLYVAFHPEIRHTSRFFRPASCEAQQENASFCRSGDILRQNRLFANFSTKNVKVVILRLLPLFSTFQIRHYNSKINEL